MAAELKPPPLRVAWFVWGMGALLYLMGFFQRVAPAVMTEELMRDYRISAGALGNLSAFYFYSYVAMQIPTGIMADRWGPRRLLSSGALAAGVGTLMFALSADLLWASVGRLVIGGSVAVAFVGMLKLANCWFPPRYYAMVSGMALFCGIIGAVFAGTPLRLLMDQFGWRMVIASSAAITLGIGAAIWLFVRDEPHEKGYSRLMDNQPAQACSYQSIAVFESIVQVLKYRNTFLLLMIPGSVVGCVLTFSGLWGVPYLTTHQHLTPPRAAMLASAVLVAWALGGPAFGWLSDRLMKRKPIYIVGCALSLIGWSVALFWNGLPFSVLAISLLVAGFSSGCMIISFALAKESVPEQLAGTVSGVVNMGVMMGPMLLQPAVGWILDRNWRGMIQNDIRLYDLPAYQSGFSVMIAWLIVALVLLFFVRETHCRQIA